MTLGFGKSESKRGIWGNGQRGGSYVPGMGTTQYGAHVYENDLGERVVQGAGLLRTGKLGPNGIEGGTLHKAYAAAPGTGLYDLIKKQKAGFPLTEEERRRIKAFWLSNPTAGLAGVGDLGGSRGASTSTNGILTQGTI